MSAIAMNRGFAEYPEVRGGLVKAMDKAVGFLGKAGITVEKQAAATEVNPFALARNVPEVLDLITAGVPARPSANEGWGNPITQMLVHLPGQDHVPAMTALIASKEHRSALMSNFGKGLTPLQHALSTGNVGVTKVCLQVQGVGAEDMKALIVGMRKFGGEIHPDHKECLGEALKKMGQDRFEKMLSDPSVRDEVLKGGVMRAFADTLSKVGMRWPEVPEAKAGAGMKLG